MSHTLSPKQLAEAIGVSESSLKRWVDGGRLQATRTAGGHRRITIQEAVRFARETGMPLRRPEVLGLPQLTHDTGGRLKADQLSDALFEMLRDGEPVRVRAVLADRYVRGDDLASLFDGPVREAMARLGELYEHGPEGIVIEHRATDLVIQSLQLLRTLIHPQADGAEEAATDWPRALGCTPSGDPYILGSLMAACVLADVGFSVTNLGPDTPSVALAEAIRRDRPALVWISHSVPDRVPGEAEHAELATAIDEVGAALVVGGRALDLAREDRPREGRYLSSMRELAAFAEGLLAAQEAAGPAPEDA